MAPWAQRLTTPWFSTPPTSLVRIPQTQTWVGRSALGWRVTSSGSTSLLFRWGIWAPIVIVLMLKRPMKEREISNQLWKITFCRWRRVTTTCTWRTLLFIPWTKCWQAKLQMWIQGETIGLQVMEWITSGMPDGSAFKAHLIESAAHMRLLTIGVLLLLVLRFSPRGLIPER